MAQMIKNYDYSTYESTLKSIDKARDAYRRQFGMEYPIPTPNIEEASLGQIRDYCQQIVSTLSEEEVSTAEEETSAAGEQKASTEESTEPAYALDCESIQTLKTSYTKLRLSVYNRLQLPQTLGTDNYEEAVKKAKEIWSQCSMAGINIELVNLRKAGDATTAAGMTSSIELPMLPLCYKKSAYWTQYEKVKTHLAAGDVASLTITDLSVIRDMTEEVVEMLNRLFEAGIILPEFKFPQYASPTYQSELCEQLTTDATQFYEYMLQLSENHRTY